MSSIAVNPYVYNSSNELTGIPDTSYTYDNNGNLQSESNTIDTVSYSWDPDNRLTSVTLPGSGGVVSFQYDPFGRRIYKSSLLGTTIFVYDGSNVIEEVDDGGFMKALYTHALGVDEPLSMQRGSTMNYYLSDGLGSITSLTDLKGDIVSSYQYDSFGNLTDSTGSISNPFLYTGREFDIETGLYFYRARYYNPSIGRFISEDPIGFNGGDTNFYVYVQNNPVNFIDPDGLKAKCCTFGDCFKRCMKASYGDWALGVLGIDGAFASIPVPGKMLLDSPNFWTSAFSATVRSGRSTILTNIARAARRFNPVANLIAAGAGGYLIGLSISCSQMCAADCNSF
ncbi:MAG: RHS repeat domain-containing protein [Planctomycetota bacterium]